ncbi:proofreading thioesterase EntH [mine drainage metagenome]|uniref:Proofreading thioesterase EntH n=1 Tax=mine drainage metagenome TaxID=410659 RepID=A0A1J5QKI7_9ZZZZ
MTKNYEEESSVEFETLLATIGPDTLGAKLGIKLVSASRERVVATMPVEGNTQPMGLLHGGASLVLAESLGSYGAAIHAGPGKAVVGLDINATHHRSARSGLVTGVATPLSAGKTVATFEVVISNESGERICTARITCLIREAKS